MVGQEPLLTVQVRFMGDLRGLLGQAGLTLSLPQGSTLTDLLTRLCDRYGEALYRRLFTRAGVLEHTVVIFHNGTDARDLAGLATPLEGGQVEVVMLPMFEGG